MRPWIIPVLALLLFSLARVYAGQWAEANFTLLSMLVYGMGIAVLVLSQLFSLGRTGLAAVLVTANFALVQWQLQSPLQDDSTYWWYFWLTTLLPLNLAALRFFPELRPLSLAGLTALAQPLIQVGILALVFDSLQTLPDWLLQLREQRAGGLLPLPAWISTGIAIAVLITRPPRKADVPAVLSVVVLLHGWMFFAFASPFISLLCALISQLVLLLVLVVSNHQLAFMDELTSLPGRRALMNDLKHRHGQFILVMADIDHFKQFNDTHGHDTGDDVLRLVASQLGAVQGGGKAYRYGGEEFTLVFSASDLKQVRPHIEATRERIAAYPLVLRNREKRPPDSRQGRKQRGQASKGKVLHVTMSFGAALRVKGESTEALMKRADKALYKAKQNGRNRVEVAVS